MKKYSKQILLSIFFFWINIFYSQNIEYDKLSREVFANNQKGKHTESQKIILKLLENKNNTPKDNVRLYILLAETFRSINNFGVSINYFNDAEKIAQTIHGEDSLKISIQAGKAFAYFDNHDYSKSKIIMANLSAKNYRNLDQQDYSYILMQEGYIYYLENNFDLAQKKYNASLEIMQKVSPCDIPVILVKKMQLFGKKNDLESVEKIYQDCIKLSDSCKILKYKIYATDELKNIYKKNGLVEKSNKYHIILDSLNELERRNEKISEMYNNNEEFMAKMLDEDKKKSTHYLLIAIGICTIFSIAGFYLYREAKKTKRLKKVTEQELEEMKAELQKYTKEQFSIPQNKNENKILNSQKLTERQKELLNLLSQGYTNKEIAEKLFISENTVKFHIKNIYLILGLKSRKELYLKIK